MKYDTKKDTELKIRLSSEDKLLLIYVAAKNGHNVSNYMRLLIESVIFPIKRQIQLGDKSYDDIKAICDNFVQQQRFFKK